MSIVLNEVSLTVTYDGDCSIPGTEYGTEIPVQVEMNTDNSECIADTMVIKIGDYTFLPQEVQYWQRMIDQAKAMVEAYQNIVNQ